MTSRSDDGAAAVEFALVLPVLVLILFGIIDYGLYFSNSIGARSGLQSAVRQAVVDNIDPNCATPSDHSYNTTPSAEVGSPICMVKARTEPVSGETFVKVVLPTDPTDPTDPAQTRWVVGQPLLVCEVVQVKGLTGYVPLPRSGTGTNGVIRDKVVMQIESHDRQDATHNDHDKDLDQSVEEGSPPGDWSWCTT
jgi:Flp pilus assembly protein TadG